MWPLRVLPAEGKKRPGAPAHTPTSTEVARAVARETASSRGFEGPEGKRERERSCEAQTFCAELKSLDPPENRTRAMGATPGQRKHFYHVICAEGEMRVRDVRFET